MSTASEVEIPGQSAEVLPTERLLSAAPRRWLPALLFAAAGLALFTLYFLQARTVPITSDGAFPALQAWAIAHGNVLLHGWSLGDVSFYTTEIPQYMLVELAFGLHSVVVPVAAAMSYTLVVLLAALLAKGTATGREGAVRATVAGGIMLAPAQGLSQDSLLSSVDHTGTQVALLLIWLVLDRAGQRWWVPVAVTLLLIWAQIADPIVTYEGVLPLVAVCLVSVYRGRRPTRRLWFDLSLAVGAIASAGAAALALRLIRNAGGFATAPLVTVFSAAGAMTDHVWASMESVLLLFGADFFGLMIGTSAVMALVHLAGVGLACWAVAVAVRRPGSQDLVVRLLVVALFVLLLSFLFTPRGEYAYNVHEIVGVLPIGAVLAGRVLAGRFISSRLVPALAAVLACYAGMLIYDSAQPPAATDQQQVASWLVAHHLTYGLAGYWYASSVTLDSGNQVQVRPIARVGRRTLVINPWEVQTSWYSSRLHDARFVIVPSSPGTCYTVGCLRQAPEATYGPPAATYRVGDLLVLVWNENLLDVRFSRIPAQVP